jgi:hypothetical protein
VEVLLDRWTARFVGCPQLSKRQIERAVNAWVHLRDDEIPSAGTSNFREK